MLWNNDIWRQAPFNALKPLHLDGFNCWPDCEKLNKNNTLNKRFVCQDGMQDDGLYYEQLIHQHHCIPTRQQSWHDLFNAAIWMLFEKSKTLLNQQHIEDIDEYGLSPRSPRRNRITHFDECGVILAHYRSDIPELLANHQWLDGMYERRQQWGQEIQPFIFGHANYEMMLRPFIGLTGKWLAIEVEPGFFNWPLEQRYRYLDDALAQRLQANVLGQKNTLKPLPLLGVPGWYTEQDRDFYLNADYFRPKRPDKKK